MVIERRLFGGTHSILMGIIRIILILAFVSSVVNERVIVQFVSLLALLITIVPWIFRKYFKIETPVKLEIIILLFVYGILFLGEVRGLYTFWWWDSLLNFIASVALGFVGYSMMYVLYKEGRIDTSPFFISLLAFCFAVSLSTLWEIMEFSIDFSLGTGLQGESLFDTMGDLIVNFIGALFVSAVGFVYLQRGSFPLVSSFIVGMVEKNLWVFGGSKKGSNLVKKIKSLIKEGENERIEFKSSFRTNLHTKEFDRRMEHNILKTITAFLNTKGGSLLVGVNDGGHVVGLEYDNFQSDDKAGLHLTNLIRTHIGNEFLPFIKFGIASVDGKSVILVECRESRKRVFLKIGGEEEFYVRNGPASVRLEGSSLVDYIGHKFGGG